MIYFKFPNIYHIPSNTSSKSFYLYYKNCDLGQFNILKLQSKTEIDLKRLIKNVVF